MNFLVQIQSTYNAASRDRWQRYAEHRRHVTDLLYDAGPGSLCVLGAGNCNDLDLQRLRERFGEIHLVDLDGASLSGGVARQGLANWPGLKQHVCDVTGMLEVFAGWSVQAVLSPADVAACAEWPVHRVARQLPGPFTVAASVCLLSQLIGAAVRTLTPAHPRFLEVVLALRTGHLRLLHELVAPGGWGFLVTDVVASETVPGLRQWPEATLPQLLPQLAATRNFFHGCNPAVLSSLVQPDAVLGPQLASAEVLRPWLWDFDDQRTYLVWAGRFRKVSAVSVPLPLP